MTGAERPRRRRLGAEERRDQLVQATVAVLAERGYRGTTAEEVARRAGVAKGLLWHYFADLDDLLVVTARRTLLVLRGAVAARVDLTAPVPQVVRAAVRGAAALRETHGRERRALSELVLNVRGPDGAPRFGLEDFEDTYLRQEALFARGQREGDLRADVEPRLLAVTYQGAVDGMLGHLDQHPDADADDVARAVADVLLEGLRAPHDH